MMTIEKLEVWLEKQILECEKRIDRGQPFHWNESEKNAYEKVLEFLKKSK